MREINIKVYSFDELSPDIQEVVIEANRRIIIGYNDWYHDTLDYWKERLEKMGFMNPSIYFSGFYNQGDGASFTADCDSNLIMDTMVQCVGHDYGWEYEKVRLWLELADQSTLYFDTTRIDHRYSHKNSVQYGVFEDFLGFNERTWKIRDDKSIFKVTSVFEKKCRIEDLDNYFEYFCHSICDKIYEDLRTECEYLESDTAIREHFEASDHEFFEDGTISEL